ncbi:hypothetical protein PV327_010195 [Microctonus hyperodae]|uniref:FHA domain-containing protein n=1 Tax=Microctonus hyperodae TaxID=165561 RepID=A0AA39FRS7_MICHY|nr:hypothetical protein PV327_010195 [Microctonus hyperodae]
MKMWTLTNTIGNVIKIDEKKITTVGRRNSDLLLENDNSISKTHAKILVLKSDDSENEDKLTCIIMDAGSKYGSYVIGKNNELTRITSDGYHVKHLDKIRFGLQQHIFTVSYKSSHRYIVLVSRIYGDVREKLSEVLQTVGGVLCDEWSPECTHVTCPTVKLTEKVLCALVTGLYVVTKDYWYAMSEALQVDNGIYPNPEDYTPKVDSSILVTDKISLLPNSQRKTLFKDKIFIYFDEDQRKIYSQMIELAGGLSIMYDETWKPQDCCNDNVIVVQSIDSNQSNQSFQCRAVYLRLSQQKLRRIPEFEIPLAILYCSIKQYCNPHFNCDNLLKPDKDSKDIVMLENSSKVIIKETQKLSTFTCPNINNKKQINQIIPESASIGSQIQSQQMTHGMNEQTPSIKLESIMYEENITVPELECRITRKTSQMQSQVSHDTNKKTASVSETVINKKNIIIPESESLGAQMSLQTQSHKKHSKDGTVTQSKKNNVSESNLAGTEMSSESSLNANEENSAAILKLQSNNKKQKQVKPRVMQVETVIPPIFSTISAQNERRLDDIWEPFELNDPMEEFRDENNELEIEPSKKKQHHISESSTEITAKKRTINEISPKSSNKKNENSLEKKRKLNNGSNSNVYSPTDEDIDEPTPRNHITPCNEININDPSSVVVGVSNIDKTISHYFSRNNLNKPKCIVPCKRLTLNDMVEWKPHKQS